MPQFLGVLVSKLQDMAPLHTTSSWSVATLFRTVLNKGRRELDYGFVNGTLIECTTELQFVFQLCTPYAKRQILQIEMQVNTFIQ